MTHNRLSLYWAATVPATALKRGNKDGHDEEI